MADFYHRDSWFGLNVDGFMLLSYFLDGSLNVTLIVQCYCIIIIYDLSPPPLSNFCRRYYLNIPFFRKKQKDFHSEFESYLGNWLCVVFVDDKQRTISIIEPRYFHW